MNEETLFHATLAKSNPSERAAFLDGACVGKPDLRAAVQALLAAHEASGPFLDDVEATLDANADRPRSESAPPTGTATVEFRSDARPNALIAGRYMLQDKIGEGGMGEVWVAKQSEPVKRKVALKLIKQGMDSRAVLQRFEQERQALAMMDHPNIAKVLDAGLTPNGQPFFAMELVNGLPLNKFCDEAKLTTKDRLELFVTICQAVQHAHQKGIVHRDLKPANILITIIDGRPVPKVIDFGVAKATAGKLTDESMSTQFGAIVGTLEYMSPEQAGFSGEDIDTRADIYSLGVILYEMLTGLRPLDAARLRKAAMTEMIRIIREEEPSKPSTRLSTDEALPSMAALRQTDPRKLMALLRDELDWVVMKCLEKQRDRRYETASGLARDVRRYLADEMVEARPPSAGYRLKKLYRKHRVAIATASAFVGVLIAGVGVSAAMAINARRAEAATAKERDRAIEAEKAATEQKTRAQDREQMAIEAVKKFRDAVANNPELKNNLSLETLRKTLLKEPLAFFKDLRNRLQADKDTSPKSLARLAQASFQLGLLTEQIGDKQDALIAYRESLAIYQKLVDASPTVTEFQSGLANSLINIGSLLSVTGSPEEALKAFESALAIQQKLADANPTATEFQSSLATSHYKNGTLLSVTGKPNQALRSCKLALTIQQKLADANPNITEFQARLAGSHNSTGAMLQAAGKPDEAMKAHESARAIQQKLADANPAVTEFQSQLAYSLNNIGILLQATGKPDEAMKAFKSSRAIQQKLADANPSVSEFQSGLANSVNNIGVLLLDTGKPAEALKAHESALAIRRKLTDANPNVSEFQSGLADSHNNIGVLLLDTGKPDAALKAHESARAVRQKLVDANPTVSEFQSGLADSHNNIGNLLRAIGKPDEALKAHESALAIRQKLAREHPESPDYASKIGGTLNNIAVIAIDSKHFDTARDVLRQAILSQKKALAANPRNTLYRQYMTSHLTNLIRAAQGLGDSEGVADAQRQLAEFQAGDPSFQALDARLAAVMKGEAAKDNPERLALAQRAYDTKHYGLATRLWDEAFRTEPKLCDDPRNSHRYDAACAAAMAGCGKGKDDPAPDDAARAKLRQQALDWLKAELAIWSKLAESGPPQARPFIAQTLKHWQDDTDLAGIRDNQELTRLPEAERRAWRDLWADVDALFKKVEKPAS